MALSFSICIASICRNYIDLRSFSIDRSTLNREYFVCKTKMCFMALAGKENIFLHKDVILNDINEQDTSFLDCKHKHMMKSGAPPDKVRGLQCLLPIQFHDYTSRIDF